MPVYVIEFEHYPGWWTAWCLVCQRNVYVGRDRTDVQEHGFLHDDEWHRFSGPEFVDPELDPDSGEGWTKFD